jgi:hypothetical protein
VPKIYLNHKTVRKLLRHHFAEPTNNLAQRITDKASEGVENHDDHEGHVFMQPYTTDRAAAGVLAPTELQAREGRLTRAAAELGLEVKSKGGK